MINRRRGAALAALAAATLALGLAGCGDDDADTGEGDEETTAIPFSSIADSGASGQVSLTQDGDRVSGTIELDGLEPGTAHAMHVHGVAGEDHGCAEPERTAEHLIDLPDLLADDDGVGRIEIDVESPLQAIRSGTYIMVHRDPGAHDAEMDGMDDGMGDATSSAARIILVHNGEDHSSPEDAEAHRAGDNPPIACAEFSG